MIREIMNTNTVYAAEDEIDIKEVFGTIFRYRYMIVFLVIVFGLGSVYYAYLCLR